MIHALFQFDKPGRLPDTGIPVIQNGSKVNDMVWDPFNAQRILVGRSVKNLFMDTCSCIFNHHINITHVTMSYAWYVIENHFYYISCEEN